MDQAMVEKIRAAIDAVDTDPHAGTKRGSHTLQTRRVAAALRAIGLKRSEFRARVTYEYENRTRIYGHAIGSPYGRAGTDLVLRYADELAAGGVRVHLAGEASHFISSGRAAVVDHRAA